MSNAWHRWIVLLALLFTCAACGLAPSDPVITAGPTMPVSGGTLRVVVSGDQTSFARFHIAEDPAALDPHLDAYASFTTPEVFRCCLARALLSTNGRSTEEGGVHLQPDLASEAPIIADDGLSWTFKIRRGLHYSPPLEEVEITAQDIVRSFHRMLHPGLVDSFGATIFTDIVGADAYRAGEAASIAGLEAPDSHTLVIRLTNPAGDLGARLALPLAIPIPASPADPAAPYGVATGHDDGYGRFAVSSGPYMIDGAADLDFSVPADDQTPVSGLVAGERLVLVRNPSWVSATDPLRPALPDRIEFSVASSAAEAASAVYEGAAHLLLHLGTPPVPTEVVDAVESDPSLGTININQSDTIASVMMNTAQPPFDDVDVRRAVAFALDKAALIEVVGPYIVRPAHHVVPDAMEDNLLVDYRPYPSVGDHGDLDAARGHMRLSRYDTDGDGLCDAASCNGAVAYTRDQGFFTLVAESVREDLEGIGIDLDVQVVEGETYFGAIFDPAQHVAMFLPLGWVKDSLSPASFFVGQFYSPVALAEEGNGSLVGASPEQLTAWGYETTSVPTVDDRIEACLPLVGSASFECWASLDQYMSENVVSSVSFGLGISSILSGSGVDEYVWDQLVGAPSYDQIVIAQE